PGCCRDAACNVTGGCRRAVRAPMAVTCSMRPTGSQLTTAHWTRVGEAMEQIVHLQIQRLPEGAYLATSVDVPGLVAQGRTLVETLEIARDVARKLMEAHAE